MHLEPSRTSMIKTFCKNSLGVSPVKHFCKSPIIDVLLGSKHVFGYDSGCEEVKFETLILIGSKCTHEVICLFKQTIKQTIHSVNCAMARWLKHKNKFIMYLIVEKIINQIVFVWDMRY